MNEELLKQLMDRDLANKLLMETEGIPLDEFLGKDEYWVTVRTKDGRLRTMPESRAAAMAERGELVQPTSERSETAKE